VYSLIGALYSLHLLNWLDKQIADYENGYLTDEDDINQLKHIEYQMSIVGSKAYVAFFFILTTLFWLPMMIFKPPSR